MGWGRTFFEFLMGFGVVISFLAKQWMLAIFFAIICIITVWSMKRRDAPLPGKK